MKNKKRESLFWGIILLGIGLIFLLDNFGLDIDLWDAVTEFWPMILIIIGIKMIYTHISSKNEKE
jgi:lia operon protein LiaF